MDIVLVAGLWLPVSIWDDVGRHLEGLGHRPLPAALPGVDDGSASATLSDQLDAVLEVVDSAERPLVVGHSAACTLVWMVADRRPDRVDRVVLVGGFPSADGTMYADFFPVVDGVMPFPGWEPFEGADAADLDDAERSRIASAAIAVPGGVAHGAVVLRDERRFDVPVLLVCPEYSPDEARAWIDGGDVPELSAASDVAYVDLDSGHWPMVTRSAELAIILDEAGRRTSTATGGP
jgi:pimeloyl-ACP methyl ester carboxylesterase